MKEIGRYLIAGWTIVPQLWEVLPENETNSKGKTGVTRRVKEWWSISEVLHSEIPEARCLPPYSQKLPFTGISTFPVCTNHFTLNVCHLQQMPWCQIHYGTRWLLGFFFFFQHIIFLQTHCFLSMKSNVKKKFKIVLRKYTRCLTKCSTLVIWKVTFFFGYTCFWVFHKI